MSIDYDRLKALVDETPAGPWEVEALAKQYAGCPETTDFYLSSDGQQDIALCEATDQYHAQAERNFALIALAPDVARELLRLHDVLDDLLNVLSYYCSTLHKDHYPLPKKYLATYADKITVLLQGDEE